MSPNTENATSRLLFAILRQKSLKDINWNDVAADPVLFESIPNGHAARMRYCRYRDSVLRDTTSKRKTSGDQHRVTKVKRESNGRSDGMVKSESGLSLFSLAQLSPASISSPYMGDMRDDYSTRFLTPCSDSDGRGLTMHPGTATVHRPSLNSNINNNINSAAGIPSAFDAELIFSAGHEPNSLEQSPMSAFDDAYEMAGACVDAQGQALAEGFGMTDMNNVTQTQQDFDNNWGNPLHDGALF